MAFECLPEDKWVHGGARSSQGQRSGQVRSGRARTGLGAGPAGSGSGGQALRTGTGGVPRQNQDTGPPGAVVPAPPEPLRAGLDRPRSCRAGEGTQTVAGQGWG